MVPVFSQRLSWLIHNVDCSYMGMASDRYLSFSLWHVCSTSLSVLHGDPLTHTITLVHVCLSFYPRSIEVDRWVLILALLINITADH